MIGRLRGSVVERTPGQLLLDVGGVGYDVEISLTTFAAVGDTGEPITLHTQLIVREDAQILFGFYSLAEREMFRSLIKVNGVGPKMALAILSGLEADEFARAILGGDLKALTGLPGVGKKTAERLIVEMKDKVQAAAPINDDSSIGLSAVTDDVESALIGLGYRPQEAALAISRVEAPAEDVETLIKQALKVLMQK